MNNKTTPAPARVSLSACQDYDPQHVRLAVQKALQPLGTMSALIKSGQNVLLKPNLVVARRAELAVSTHPEVVRAVALEVLEVGAKPIIADSPGFGSAQSVCAACGLDHVAKELGIEIHDLSKNPEVRRLPKDSPFQTPKFGAIALQADAIINLPKVKAHAQTGMTCAVKNLYGTVSGKRKALYHFRAGDDIHRFCKFICAITRYLNPVLNLADGIIGLESYGPTRGDPRALGFLAASVDPVALDRIVLELLAVPTQTVPTMAAARALAWGEQDLDAIEILGQTLDSLRVEDFRQVPEAERISINFPPSQIIRSYWRQFKLTMRSRSSETHSA